MIAKSYLLTAPAEASDLLGQTMTSGDIITKLKAINPEITVWEQYAEGLWWPGKDWADTDWGVKTSLWIGPPGEETSQKITAINLGAVPEFTQIGPDGRTIVKGWRQIFEKVIKSGACSRISLERAFGVTLAYVEGTTLLCHACLRQGKRRRHNGGMLRLCKLHEQVVKACREYLAAVKEGPEAVAVHNADVQRRVADVDVQVHGESRVGWTPAAQSGANRGDAQAAGGVRGEGHGRGVHRP